MFCIFLFTEKASPVAPISSVFVFNSKLNETVSSANLCKIICDWNEHKSKSAS